MIVFEIIILYINTPGLALKSVIKTSDDMIKYMSAIRVRMNGHVHSMCYINLLQKEIEEIKKIAFEDCFLETAIRMRVVLAFITLLKELIFYFILRFLVSGD